MFHSPLTTSWAASSSKLVGKSKAPKGLGGARCSPPKGALRRLAARFPGREDRSTRMEIAVWTRAVVGIVLCLTGAVWIAQGTDALHGSGMTGHGIWTVIGSVLVALGVASLAWAWRIRNQRATDSGS